MSSSVNPTTNREIPLPNPDTTAQEPRVLNTAGRVTKLIATVLAAIAAIGLLAIAITLTPFFPEAGAGALALSATFFAIAGGLFYTNTNTPPATPLKVRQVSALA